ncbi:MAG: hypothetical protein HYY84_10910 [Deltaproteobacteria bacterium]|nr:hypothetical protein [Deltaproteobacteria bacterium]
MVRILAQGGVVAAIAFAVGVPGCGYRFRTDVPAVSVRRVAVSPFANDTFEVGIERPFSEALREVVLRSAALRLAPRREAEAVLRGRVLAFGASPIAYPGSATGVRVGAYRASASVEVELVRADGHVLWRRGPLARDAEYLTGATAMATDANKNRAIRQIAWELMGDFRAAFLRGR